MSRPAIVASGLGKRYLTGGAEPLYGSLREALARSAGRLGRRIVGRRGSVAARQPFWALRDLDLEVPVGEVLGVIGPNGAGKSTLLKVLSQITRPDAGRVEITGRVGSLLEVGTGFHPELTGRENIFLNGAILGMSRREIRSRFDDIVAFAEVGQFLDTPVKRYSSGMYVRLGFAVAAHLEPEVLLVDEVLAVGDVQFQKRCLGTIGSAARSGRTVLFVSHNMAAVEGLCSRVLFLDHGRAVSIGAPRDAIARYLAVAGGTSGSVATDHHPRRRHGSSAVFRRLRLASEGAETSAVAMGRDLVIEADLEHDRPIRSCRVGFVIENAFGQRVLNFSPTHQCPDLFPDRVQRGRVRCRIPSLQLLPGLYFVTLIVGSGVADIDRIDQATSFFVEAADVFGTGAAPGPEHGVYYQVSAWEFEQEDQ